MSSATVLATVNLLAGLISKCCLKCYCW